MGSLRFVCRLVVFSALSILPLSSFAQVAGSSSASVSPRDHARQVATQTLARFLQDHDRAKGESGFLEVTRIDPAYAPAWFNLGVFAESDKHWTEAKRYFAEYLRIAPNGPDADRAKDQLQLLATYSDGAAAPELSRQGEYDAMIQRARAFFAANLFREAVAEAGRAQAADASRWESYAVVSLCMAKQHKRDEAAKFQALALNHAPAEKREQIRQALDRQIAEWNR